MTYDNFTIKAQEAIMKAQKIAAGLSQQTVDTTHLIKGIIETDENVSAFLLQKMGVNLPVLKKQLCPLGTSNCPVSALLALLADVCSVCMHAGCAIQWGFSHGQRTALQLTNLRLRKRVSHSRWARPSSNGTHTLSFVAVDGIELRRDDEDVAGTCAVTHSGGVGEKTRG